MSTSMEAVYNTWFAAQGCTCLRSIEGGHGWSCLVSPPARAQNGSSRGLETDEKSCEVQGSGRGGRGYRQGWQRNACRAVKGTSRSLDSLRRARQGASLWLWASLICSPRARSRWSKAALTGQQAVVSSPGTRGLGGLGALGWIQWRARPSYGSSSSHDDERACSRRFRFICD